MVAPDRADLGDRHARVGAAVGRGRRRRGRREGHVGRVARVGVAGVALVGVALQLAEAVGLHERHLVVGLVGVAVHAVVDVPDQQPVARQLGVEPRALAVLHQEVLGPALAAAPQAHDLVGFVLHVGQRERPVGRGRHHRHPLLVGLAPGRGMGGRVAAAVPRPAGHQAPVADAGGRVVGVVEVGPPEEQVAELVGAHPDPRVLRDGQVRVGLRAVDRPGRCPAAPTCATRCRRWSRSARPRPRRGPPRRRRRTRCRRCRRGRSRRPRWRPRSASRAIVRALGWASPTPDSPWAYSAIVSGRR